MLSSLWGATVGWQRLEGKMSVWPPEGSPLAVTPEMEQAMKKMNYPVIKVRNDAERSPARARLGAAR